MNRGPGRGPQSVKKQYSYLGGLGVGDSGGEKGGNIKDKKVGHFHLD